MNINFIMGIFIAALVVFSFQEGHGAVGCDLNDPDRDVKRLFPESTGYKTGYFSIKDAGGDELLAKVENRLGDSFHGLYETADVPYTLYTIVRGNETIGYIHGVNQKGQYGGIQVFCAFDANGIIRGFYLQKLTSRQASQLRAPSFGAQFIGLGINDFAIYNVKTGISSGRAGLIRNPAPEAENDFKAVMRAVKKNLILMDVFVLKKGG